MKILDIVGQRFGKLVVLEFSHMKKSRSWFLCKCDCGKETIVAGTLLIQKKTQSCGCLRRKDVAGKKFGELTALKIVDVHKYGNMVWECICDCGNKCKRSLNILDDNSCCDYCANLKAYKNGYSKFMIGGTNLGSIKSKKLSSLNTTGVKGVDLHKCGKYRARLRLQNISYNLGLFNTLEEATKARKAAEDEYFKPILEKYDKI